MSDIAPDAELDCIGLSALPIARTKEEIENIEVGQVLKVEATIQQQRRISPAGQSGRVTRSSSSKSPGTSSPSS